METLTLKNTAIPELDARLSLAASFIRPGAVIADVGTDHAYLPIYLLLTGVCPHAIASDINEGPLNSARAHAKKYGVSDRIVFMRANGLADLDLAGAGVTDIAVCGMGGEMIAGILEAAPYTRNSGVQCVLQPMSSAEDLRCYLARAGYRIDDEKLAAAAGRIYTCLAVSYDGKHRVPSPAELLLGEANIRRGRGGSALFEQYLVREFRASCKKYRGRLAGSLNTSAEEALLAELETIAAENGIVLPQTTTEGIE